MQAITSSAAFVENLEGDLLKMKERRNSVETGGTAQAQRHVSSMTTMEAAVQQVKDLKTLTSTHATNAQKGAVVHTTATLTLIDDSYLEGAMSDVSVSGSMECMITSAAKLQDTLQGLAVEVADAAGKGLCGMVHAPTHEQMAQDVANKQI